MIVQGMEHVYGHVDLYYNR